jgi:membrane-bound inhibitor of C-type lysozyme
MRYITIVLGLLLIIGISLFFWLRPQPVVAPEVEIAAPTATAEYICNNSKTIGARFYEGAAATTSTDIPTPTGSVSLALSDGRVLSLKQTISASGARYSNGDPQTAGVETFIFWSQGNGALVTDNGDEKSYFGCVTMKPYSDVLPLVYHDGQNGYTIRYAEDWIIDPVYRNTSPNPDVPTTMGVRFRIPAAMATGTNLSTSDTGLSVESIESVTDCSANTFTSNPITATTVTVNGTEYSFATSSDAGAGNYYEEHIYALPYSRPCTAIHYLIHSTNIANYDPGTKTEFNRTSLLQSFDAMRDSLVTR